MTEFFQEQVSSFEAIINSIKHDAEVCRWFEFLVTHPAVRQEISSGDRMGRAYRDIEASTVKQRTLFALAVLSAVAVAVFKTWWPFLAVPLILFFWFRSQDIKNKAVLSLSEILIRRDYAPVKILSKISLYHLAEEYSQKYGIASLVDKIYCFDRVKRYAIFIFFVLSFVIWVGAFSWKIVLALVCYYELIKAALMTTAVYRRLQ
ncbi:MAG TPA: hypothetical protein P5160_04095 [Candidatus Omnitrophota bacterium]|nr:hypothetical protein [Candidatus Omnitrophota bacterium]